MVDGGADYVLYGYGLDTSVEKGRWLIPKSVPFGLGPLFCSTTIGPPIVRQF